MLSISRDTQLLKHHLPQVDVGRFVSDHHNYRRQIILCLASLVDAPGDGRDARAGDEAPVPATLAHALALAARYDVAEWEVRARWVTLRDRWATLRARWVALRARWVTLRARWVTLRAR
jgi:hypothetical protein